jgi:predicted amidohydrolase YtcJ
MNGLLIERVELGGEPDRAVLVRGGRIVAVGGRELRRHPDARGVDLLDGQGGALLPGLRDDHLHLFATAAAATSLRVDLAAFASGRAVASAPGAGVEWLAARLRAAAQAVGPGATVRAVGYHESIAGPLTATRLDELLGAWSDRRVRVQHVSGHAWFLNRAAAAAARAVPDDGVLLDADPALRDASAAFPSLAATSRRLASYGVCHVTDAGVGNAAAEWMALRAAIDAGELLQHCTVMGRPELAELGLVTDRDGDGHGGADGAARPRLTVGPVKLVLADHGLPELDDLIGQMEASGARGVAIHCVTAESLVLAAVALAQVGRRGQRIEHASVAPDDVVALVAASGARIVTQPGFVVRHGDRYRAEVEPSEQPWLYRLRAWRAAGVPLTAGSDAPFGQLDPWASMVAAVDRHTASGASLGQDERLSPEEALALFSRRPGSVDAGDTGDRPAAPRVGDPADLCLLALGWQAARDQLSACAVSATLVAGHLAWCQT